MKNKYSIIDKIGFSLLSIIIITYSIIIGANDKSFREIPVGIFLFLIVIFLIVKKVTKRDESIFIKNKIDIFVMLFMLSTILPIIFKTYSSLSYEMEFLFKYFFYYATYVLARNTIKTKDDIKEVFTVILISSFFPIILGFDDRFFHRLDGIIKFLDLKYSYNYKMPFTFGYANTMAVFMSSCIFIALYLFKNSTKKLLKTFYILYIFLALAIIYLTYARFVLILLIIFLGIYFFKTCILYFKKHYKIIVPIGIVLLISGVTFVLYASKISKPRFVSEKNYEHVFEYNFEKNKEYQIDLDIDFYSNPKINKIYDKNSFNVKIASINQYYNEDIINNKKYGNGHQVVSLNVETLNNTKQLRLYIYNNFNGSYKINKVYINGKEYIINYKYIPSKIGKFVRYLNFGDRSLDQRKTFYKMSFEIFKKHILFGNGGNAWHSMSRAYENYKFFAKETHSYFFELLVSYGLVGTVLFCILICSVFYNLFKKKNDKEMRTITYALGIILLHSITFDFNMSFMFINIFIYVLLACSIYDKNENIKYFKYLDYIMGTILIVILLLVLYACSFKLNIIDKKITYKMPVTNSMLKYQIKNYKELSSDEQISYFKYLMENEPYFNQNEVYNEYFVYIYQHLYKLDSNKIDKYLDYGINKLKTIKLFAPYYIITIYQREIILYKMINSLEKSNYVHKEKYIKELKEIFISEYENNIKIISNKDANGYEQYVIDDILNKYKSIYDEVK